MITRQFSPPAYAEKGIFAEPTSIRSAEITDVDGRVIFERHNLEFPSGWSQLAVNVTARHYMMDYEMRFVDTVLRLVNWYMDKGEEQGYFRDKRQKSIFGDELAWLLYNRVIAFNSPAWYNLGVPGHRQQVAACFISHVDDDMEKINAHTTREINIFRWGSGSGAYVGGIPADMDHPERGLLGLRSRHEHVGQLAQASGPLSYMKGWDSQANTIKCVTGDTLVWTGRGAIPIMDVVPGDIIHTGRGVGEVSEVHKSPPRPLVGVRLGHTGVKIVGTPNHPVMTMTANGIEWRNLEDLWPGDPVAVSREHHIRHDEPELPFSRRVTGGLVRKVYNLPGKMSPDLAFMLGLLCSDGSIDMRRLRVRLTNGDRDLVDAFVSTWRRVFDNEPTVRREDSKNCWEVASWAVDIVRFFNHLCVRSPAAAKLVPPDIYESSRESVIAFLRGYFDGDGHNGVDVFAVSKSAALRDGIQDLLLSIGIVSAKYTTTHGYFGVRMGGEQARLYRKTVGFTSERKREMYVDDPDKGVNTNFDSIPMLVSTLRSLSNGSGWYDTEEGKKQVRFEFNTHSGQNVSLHWLRRHPDTVLRIKEVSIPVYEAVAETLEHNYVWDYVADTWNAPPQETYDLTIPGDHSFVGNGVICHNSGGRTRRAACARWMGDRHAELFDPEADVDFIRCKVIEGRLAKKLIDLGYSPNFNERGGAYDRVQYQNANNTVLLTDRFMRAIENDDDWELYFTRPDRRPDSFEEGQPYKVFKARRILREIALALWEVGDPGVAFYDTLNRWNTVPSTGPILSSNPCGEFVQPKDTSCNLCAIKTTALPKLAASAKTNELDVLRKVVDVAIVAMDISVDVSDYPDDKITEGTKRIRPLGLGLTDLGSYLMQRGLGYGTTEGNRRVRELTSTLTGAAYLKSTALAELLGTFFGYQGDKEACAKVLSMHAEHAPSSAVDLWNDVLTSEELHGLRNSQVTLMQPTGTTAFMLDCDTTGIEPVLAYKVTKHLVGGGKEVLVNRSLMEGLKTLGYDDEKREAIRSAVLQDKGISDLIQPDHREVFATSFGDADHKLVLTPERHIATLAAIQPNISGSISKTLNLPTEATPEDIERLITLAYRSGVKNVTFYRDESRASAPLTVTRSTDKEEPEVIDAITDDAPTRVPVPVVALSAVTEMPDGDEFPVARRVKLPAELESTREKIIIRGIDGVEYDLYVHVSEYRGRPVEIFMNMGKQGHMLNGLLDAVAILVSMGLQSGTPLMDFIKKFTHTQYPPTGWTDDPKLGMAKSPLDVAFRWLENRYYSEEVAEASATLAVLTNAEQGKGNGRSKGNGKPKRLTQDSVQTSCPICGFMIQHGSCFCHACGQTFSCA